MISRLAVLISSGFGSGCVRKAPGTFGSIAAALFWLLLSWLGLLPSYKSQAFLALLVIVIGTIAAHISLDEEGGEDPQWIVIDEWAGLFVALIGTNSANLAQVLGALVGFRLFDIVKPRPVSTAEDLPGSLGIMADDVVAGALTLIGMLALRSI